MRAVSLLLAGSVALLARAQSGTGSTTRYWDCCKGSCSWGGVVSSANPVEVCDRNDNIFNNYGAADGCENGGSSYMCTNLSPFGVSNDLAYGFAGVNILNRNDTATCCSCWRLTFTNGAVQGKSMVVQAVSNSYNLDDNQFDILMPGAGVGATSGCAAQWGDTSQWGAQYGGVTSRDGCEVLPQKLRGGCYWRFDWFRGTDNPAATFTKVTCPKELTDISGCRRSDDGGASPPRSTTTTSQPQATGIPHYGQCGGRNYNGPTQCQNNYQCVFVNDNYYQCLSPGENPPNSNPAPTQQPQPTTTSRGRPPPTSTSQPAPGRDPGPYEQCAGLNYNGTNHCPSGFVCTYVDQWYSQCVQVTSTQPTSNCGARCTTALPPQSSPTQYTSVFTYTSTYVTTIITTGPRGSSTFIPRTTQRTTTTVLTPSTVQTVPPNPSSSGVAQLYDQCYGANWKGPTRCNTGLVCVKVDDYYGQCQKPS